MFDSVPHLLPDFETGSLKSSLSSIVVDQGLSNWYRLQKVVIEESCGNQLPLMSHKGHALGPLFIYLGDLCTCITHSSVKLYTDDVAL